MLPAPLAPLDPHKTRALTTIYAPRKHSQRKNKTAQSRMLDDVPVKPTLSPFHPLPAIGQKIEKPKTKVIVFDLNKTEADNRTACLQHVMKPLTPLRIHGVARKGSLQHDDRPQQLVRENTYDVIEPVFINAPNVTKRDPSISRLTVTKNTLESDNRDDSGRSIKESPKTRFRNAALQVAKLTSMPETGKLLCLRERQTFSICKEREDTCKLQRLPQSPTHKLNKVSEIFQSLDMRGRHRDKMKKENSWF